MNTFEPIALPELVINRANDHPDQVFLIDADTGEEWTFGRVIHRARQWSAALKAMGISATDPVATMLKNEPESVAVWLGVAFLNAVEVPGNLEYRGSLLRHYIETSRASVAIVATPDLADLLASEASPELTVVILEAEESDSSATSRTVSAASFSALADKSPEVVSVTASVSETASVMFTSGTTGPSKGVVIPWMQLHESAMGWMPIGGGTPERTHRDEYLEQEPRYYSPFPFHHMAARAPVHLMAVLNGCLVMRPYFKTDLFWEEIRRYQCTTTELLGTMALFLHNAPRRHDDSHNPLKSVLMVPLIDDVTGFEERFGVNVWTVYNMTELSIPIVSAGYDLVDSKSCGKARPGYELRIVDSEDAAVPPGVVGELLVRADRPWALMNGYWDMPQSTVESWRNLWFHTGDAFKVDEAGNYYFVDRKKDTIRRRGENISSVELEVDIRTHPEVADVAAVGVPSTVGEEDVKILVIRTNGSTLSEAELIEYLRECIPRFMVPRYVEWVEDLPRTPTAKVRKSELRGDWRTPTTWDSDTGDFL